MHQILFNYKRSWSFINWALAMFTFLTLLLLLYPLLDSDMNLLLARFSLLPVELKELIGREIGYFNSTIGYCSYLMRYIMILSAIQAGLIGLNFFAKQANEKGYEYLLTKPVTRQTLYFRNLITHLLILLSTQLIVYLLTAIVLLLITPSGYNFYTYTLIFIAVIPPMLIFYTISVLLGFFLRRDRNILMLSIVLPLVNFVIGLLVSLDNTTLRRICFLHYFNFYDLLRHQKLDAGDLISAALIVTLGLTGSYFIFTHKDLA